MRDRTKSRIKIITVIVSIILGVTALLVVAAHFRGYELSIKVEKDAYVFENNPSKNYGADDYLRVGNYYAGKAQALYYFNISSLPNGWTEAKITVNFDYGSNIVDVGANLTYDSWDEMAITWNNKPNKGIYRGHILCDGFDFYISLKPDQIINEGVGICLYGKGGEDDGYIQGYSKEGALSNNDIAWIELSYEGIDPTILEALSIAGIIICIILGTIGVIVLIVFIRLKPDKSIKKHKKPMKKNAFGADWIHANIGVKKNAVKADWLRAKISEYNKYRPPPILEKKINQYITLRLEHGRTFIYINGRRFIQCIRLILNIPKENVPLYDEVESIDEAAKLYSKHIYQNRIVRGPMAAPVPNQRHDITPEQEFWGHCSNIQAWVEHNYDTRILMSNISFPLLRELTKAGDPKARKVYKEEIALRLESGYPSVVQYLLAQGYIAEFNPVEFQSILESTNLIKKLSSKPNVLFQFLRSCVSKFPTLIEDILLQILKLPDGKNIFLSIIQRGTIIPSIPKIFQKYSKYSNPQILSGLKIALENLFNRVDEKTGKNILDCIKVINNKIEGQDFNVSRTEIFGPIRNMLLNNKPLGELDEQQKLLFKQKILEQIRRTQLRCSYCGKMIPKGQDICEWCGHKKDDDEGGFFPYPFIFKPPGGGGGSMKGVAIVPVKIKT